MNNLTLNLLRIKDEDFNHFMDEINTDYRDYFNSRSDDIKSIRHCFLIRKNNELYYKTDSNLPQDLFLKVINKHKELYGEEAVFNVMQEN